MTIENAAMAEANALNRARGAQAVHDSLVRENKQTRAALFAAERELAAVTTELETKRAEVAAFDGGAKARALAEERHATLLADNERLRAEISKAEARLQAITAEAIRRETNLASILSDLAAMKETV